MWAWRSWSRPGSNVTAFDLIDSIFSRVQPWSKLPSNARRITPKQLLKLRELIDEDPEGGAVTRGAPGSLVWRPAGRTKYMITEDLYGDKHTLAKFSNIVASDTGKLF